MGFSVRRLKKSIFPYVTFLAEMKLQDVYLRQQSQTISVLEDALKKNVVPAVMGMRELNTFKEARKMFSKMISDAATANITDEEVRQLNKMYLKQTIRIDILSTKQEELEDQLTKKVNETVQLPRWRSHYEETVSAYRVTIKEEMDAYNKKYESLITELPGLNISDASDASVDFVINKFWKLDEAIIRRVLDEWVAFKRDLLLAMEKFDFTVYLLDNKLDLILKRDYEGLTNVVRSDEEMLAINDREEAVSELLQNWKCYVPKGASKKKVKSFKEKIQQEKEYQYEKRMREWKREAFSKKFYCSNSIDMHVDMLELMYEVRNEDASPSAIPEGPQVLADDAQLPTKKVLC